MVSDPFWRAPRLPLDDDPPENHKVSDPKWSQVLRRDQARPRRWISTASRGPGARRPSGRREPERPTHEEVRALPAATPAGAGASRRTTPKSVSSASLRRTGQRGSASAIHLRTKRCLTPFGAPLVALWNPIHHRAKRCLTPNGHRRTPHPRPPTPSVGWPPPTATHLGESTVQTTLSRGYPLARPLHVRLTVLIRTRYPPTGGSHWNVRTC